MHHDEQVLSVWEGWHSDDCKGGWLDLELCARARREEVEYIRRHKMYTRVSRETCLRETGRAPIKTGWAETEKGQPGQPNMRARWVAKEYKTHARPEPYASTPPLGALKVVLSWHWLRTYFYAPARRRVLVDVPPEDYQPGDDVRAAAIHVRHARRRTKLGGRTHVDAQRSQTNTRGRMLVRVVRAHQGRARRGDRARRRCHDRWWTVGGGIPHQNDIEKSTRSMSK